MVLPVFLQKAEIKKTYTKIPFDVENWRKGKNLPKVQGTVVGCRTKGKRTYALIDEGDVHTLMVGAAGIGKTAFFLYPNIEAACASGMSFLQTDLKGRRSTQLWNNSKKNITATMFRLLI